MKRLLKGLMMIQGAIGMVSLCAVDSEGTLGLIFFGVFILCVFTAIPLAFIYITLFEEKETFKNESTRRNQDSSKDNDGIGNDKNKRRALQLWEIGINEGH
jgi:hypothetical protein